VNAPARIGTVIASLDDSPEAPVALPVARPLADLERAVLRIVHTGAPAPAAAIAAALGLDAQTLAGGVVEHRDGPTAAAVVAAAAETAPAIVVIAAHAGDPAADTGLGAVARAILCTAPCPVVVVPPARGRTPWTLRRVLLPYDARPTTAHAVCHAAVLAERAAATVDVLYVGECGAAPPREQGALPAPSYVDQPQHEWPAWVDELLDRLRAECPLDPTCVHLSLGHGDPGSAIVRWGREHDDDLIVLGWSGMLDAAHGTTLRAVVRDAPCPVLVFRVA